MNTRLTKFLFALTLIGSLIAACAAPASTDSSTGAVKLILGAYTTPREAYGEILPLFAGHWKEKTGQDVSFEESYLGSGAQSRAVVDGFEADVVALSLDGDVNRIANAGLITHDWHTEPYGGFVSTSIVVFAVRDGNPKGIKDWADLAQPGLEILTPDPATSGGAQWNILSLYGAALRGHIDGVPAKDETAATGFLKKVIANVAVFDRGARESIINFEQGIGDLAISYENEVWVGQRAGQDYDLVIPASSILIQNPVAVVDTYVDKHGTREVAEAFVAFLFTKEAQEIFARHGLRSLDPEVAAATASQYPVLTDTFTIDEQFGGWAEAAPKYFGENGIYIQAIAEVQQGQ